MMRIYVVRLANMIMPLRATHTWGTSKGGREGGRERERGMMRIQVVRFTYENMPLHACNTHTHTHLQRGGRPTGTR